MKKILLCLPLLTLLAVMIGCTAQQKWNREQRKAMRQELADYRTMAYLDDLSDAEFTLFADDVALALEEDYPVYATFIELPGKDDTVQMVIVSTIVEELNADARNMRHIFPYKSLVQANRLPAGLSREQQHAYYTCLAGKVNSAFATLDGFVNAVVADTVDTSLIGRLEAQCAGDLFNWTITEINVVETE